MHFGAAQSDSSMRACDGRISVITPVVARATAAEGAVPSAVPPLKIACSMTTCSGRSPPAVAGGRAVLAADLGGGRPITGRAAEGPHAALDARVGVDRKRLSLSFFFAGGGRDLAGDGRPARRVLTSSQGGFSETCCR